MYSKKVMERFSHPKFHKKLKKFNGVGEVGNIRCGDIIRIYIFVQEDIIKEVSFETYGCIAAIAASDMMCELAKGKTIEEAEKITDKEITKDLGDLPAIKFHCSVLGTKALKAAIADYKKK